MSEQLKKQIEKLRGIPVPSVKFEKKPTPPKVEKKKREELKEIRTVQAPPVKVEKDKKKKKVSEQERRAAVTPKVTKIQTQKEIEAQKEVKIPKKSTQELTGLAQAQKAKTQAQDVTISIQSRKAKRFKEKQQKIIDDVNKVAEPILSNPDKYTKESFDEYKSTIDEFNEKAKENLKKYDNALEDLSKSKNISKKNLQEINAYLRRLEEKPELERLAVREVETPVMETIDKLEKSDVIRATKTGGYALDKPVEKLTLEERRSLERLGFALPVIGKNEAERYKNRLESMSSWFANLVHQDVFDEKDAERIIKENEQLFLSTIQYGPDPGKELVRQVDQKLSELEKKAKYGEYKGYTIFGLKKLPPEIVEARVAHLALSTAVGAAKYAPFVAAETVGGPVVSGLIGASMIATLANPKNRDMLKQYAREHPEQFLAELTGALALGWSVGQVKTLYNKYKHDIPDPYTQQFEMQLATDVPDFPSTRTEELHPWFEEVVFTKFVSKLSPEDALKFAKSADAVLYWGSGDEYGQSLSIYELIETHPTLDKPMAIYLPNIKRLTPKYADLITKVPGEKNMYIMPAAIAAILLSAQQGYITEDDIKTLIEQIEIQNAEIKLDKLKLEIPWDDEFLSQLTLPDLITIVDVIPTTATTPIVGPVTDVEAEVALDIPTIEVPDLPKIEELEEPPPPETPKMGLPKADVEMSKFRPQLFRGPRSKYRIEFHYRNKEKQSVTVEARSYPEALSKAQRIRRITHELPNMVDMYRIK